MRILGFADKLNKHLSLQVLLAILLGIVTGVLYPGFAVQTQIVSLAFVAVIKPFIGPVIFLTVVSLFGSMVDLKRAGRISLKSFIYFELISMVAIMVGICCALIIRPGAIERSSLNQLLPRLSGVSGGTDWSNGMMTEYTILFLAFGIGIGLLINLSKHRGQIVGFLENARNLLFIVLRYVFLLAPLAAYCGIAYTVGKFGVDSLVPVGKLVAATYLSMFFFILVVFGGILRYFKVSLFSFLKSIKQELLYVLGTSSSTSVLPLLMDRLEIMGYRKSVVSLVTVTGNSFNLTGTCLYMGVAVIFLAQLYQIHFSFTEMLTIIMVILMTSKGATGISGAGFVALATTIGTIHKIPVEGLAILLSIDRFMSEARAITNTIGHGVATVVISRNEPQ